MGKKKFDFSEHWAQQIIRVDAAGKEKICAYVFRKYADDDVDRQDPGKYIGLDKIEIKDMITDTDPESETFNQRIPDPTGEVKGTKIKFVEEFNDKTIENYKKLVGLTNAGKTEFIYKFRDIPYHCDDEEEFWTTPLTEIRKIYTGRKQIIQLNEPVKAKK